LKSLNISFASPATAWHVTHAALPKKSMAPRFWAVLMALRWPRAN
jgi:hypothetical protein